MVDENTKNERHKARMQKTKAKVDERIAAAQEEKGLLIVITGNGKGKSTSGFGTVARAAGHGLKVGGVQFIKGTWACGERELLTKAGVEFHVMGTGFTWNTQDRDRDIASAVQAWEKAKELLADKSLDLVMLDEITYMLTYKYLDLKEVLAVFANRPPMQHLIVTGRACHREVIAMADTVSEVQSVKHAFENGIKAQKGIDW